MSSCHPEYDHHAGLPPTPWTLIIQARDGEEDARHAALQFLCETYWQPVYAYIRSKGKSSHDAEDLVQGFFIRVLEPKFLAQVQQERGSFRHFLRAAVSNYVNNEWQKSRTLKRGGHIQFQSLDFSSAEAGLSQHEIVDPEHADMAFDRQWAMTLLKTVLADLRREFELDGKTQHFNLLRVTLTAQRVDAHFYAQAAAELAMTPAAVKMMTCRLRKRFRQGLRQEVRRTVADEAQIEQEMQYLMQIFAKS